VTAIRMTTDGRSKTCPTPELVRHRLLWKTQQELAGISSF